MQREQEEQLEKRITALEKKVADQERVFLNRQLEILSTTKKCFAEYDDILVRLDIVNRYL